jgi:hypothetical protein
MCEAIHCRILDGSWNLKGFTEGKSDRRPMSISPMAVIPAKRSVEGTPERRKGWRCGYRTCMHRLVTIVLVVVGLALVAVGIVYFTVKAGSLPSFFPGHIVGSSSHRTKHGIAALVLGVVVLAFSVVAGSLMRRR